MKYIEFGGGLGDVIHQVFTDGGYRSLEALLPHERVKVGIISHNPACATLFDHHPKRHQLEIVAPGYWLPEQDASMRRAHELPRYDGTPIDPNLPLNFYPSRSEVQALDRITRRHRLIVLAPNAGEVDRDIPFARMTDILDRIRDTEFVPAQVGLDYERNDRPPEMRYSKYHRAPFIDLVGYLSVPATLALVASAAAVVTCHSAVNMMAWHQKRRQLLLYPEMVRQRHFVRPDQWSFGVWREPWSALTHHGLFHDSHPVESFFNALRSEAEQLTLTR
jgi:hypothetical protein